MKKIKKLKINFLFLKKSEGKVEEELGGMRKRFFFIVVFFAQHII